jgi:probable F420-dependent oxidoreductase
VTATEWQIPPELPATGVWSHAISRAGAGEARETVQELEELGVPAIWYPEGVATKESLAFGALLLSWTRSLTVVSGITSVYSRDATAAANGARTLGDAFPGRFVLGLGVSHATHVASRGHDYARPLATMTAYLDAMDAATFAAAGPERTPARVLAALNPRMLRLAADRCAGAHTYFMPPAHTARAREALGPGRVLAVELAFSLDDDPDAVAAYVADHVNRDNYRRALLFSGFDEEDVAGGGSARLVDAVVVRGGPDALVARMREHFDAGATHVCVQAIGADRSDPQLGQLREVAPALRELAEARAVVGEARG